MRPEEETGPAATEERARPLDFRSAEALRVAVEGGTSSVLVSARAPMRTHVGTSALCELVLSDLAVSRRHLAIEPSGAVFRVIDLGSKNGTLLNGVPIVE